MSGLRRLLRYGLIAGVLCLMLLLPTAPARAMGGQLPLLNEPAPGFTLPTNDGKGQLSLDSFRGKWVVLYFYPKDFTPGCTLEAQRFQRDLAKYQAKNAQVVGVSADSVDTHAEFCNSEGLKFPLLADEDGSVSKLYGSWMGYLSMRHTFIVDPDGVLRERMVKVAPAVHSTEVLERLAELQA
ncbi:peroxiredoxin [Altericista sp. CCNU0014]|uniref:peroxiredoxin n=1 Tax=Altericista sp. CCNU0014 TaxID=3082949 RepID=UPI00384F2FDE